MDFVKSLFSPQKSLYIFFITLFFFFVVLFSPFSISDQKSILGLELNYVLAQIPGEDIGGQNTNPVTNTNVNDATVGSGVNFGLNSASQKQLEKFCSFYNPGTWFTNCLVEVAFNVSSAILNFSGGVFDYFLGFTLSNDILSSEAVSDAWSSIRDVANLAFIVGLIYISFSFFPICKLR